MCGLRAQFSILLRLQQGSTPCLDFEIVPIDDITETTRLLGEGVGCRESV
jgi:hypothetical protein